MKHFFLALFTLFVGLALTVPDADAKRLGSGRNTGMQRQAEKKQQQDVQPSQAAPQQGMTPQTPQKRSWMGPIAGLAAGLGLAALASHFGFGEGMANFLIMALLALGAFMLLRWFMNRNKPAPRPMQFAGAGNGPQPVHFQAPSGGGTATAPAAPAGAFPPGFDAVAFARQAKVNFLRLQAANDAGNLDDIREFTTPEMYAEIKLDIDERKGAVQRTEVTLLEAEVLEAVEEDNRHIASVRFHGMLKEDSEAAAPFDETWHLTRAASGKGGWVVAGIQQNG